MERESNQAQTLCRSGCGFFGSPATDGLCSLCYKEALKKKQQLPTATPSAHCAALTTASTTTSPIISSIADFDVTDRMSHSHLPSRTNSEEYTSVPPPSTSDSGCATPTNQPSKSNIKPNEPDQDEPCNSHAQEEHVCVAGEQQQAAASAAIPSDAVVPCGPNQDSSGPSENTDNTNEDKDGDKDKKKKSRCGICRKKVGLTGFQCRCGGLFCAVHRYSDKHECNFNYREMGAQEIRRNNPVVVGEKIQKI